MIKDIVYLNNAATTFVKPQEVHDFMHDFYSANSINVGRGDQGALSAGSKLVEETRQMILDLFGANTNYQTIFTPSATEAINVIMQGQIWKAGDNIYISPFEHNAVYRVVKFLEREKGIKLQFLDVDRSSLCFDIEKIKYQFSQNAPKFVVISHVSNVCGNIAPINKIGKLVTMFKDAQYLIDCAQSAGLLETNIVDCLADYMVFAGHKTLYGPLGCSGFVCKKNRIIKPLIYGGTGIDSANEDMPLDMPTRLEAGSQNIMAIAGLNAALKWIKYTGIENIRTKEKENYDQLYKVLMKYNFIHMIGVGQNTTSIISCKFDGLSPDNVENILAQKEVFVRSGLHCSPLAHMFLGTYPEGMVRFSISYFNINYAILCSALEDIKESLI